MKSGLFRGGEPARIGHPEPLTTKPQNG